jgi:hypothetical protein
VSVHVFCRRGDARNEEYRHALEAVAFSAWAKLDVHTGEHYRLTHKLSNSCENGAACTPA